MVSSLVQRVGQPTPEATAFAANRPGASDDPTQTKTLRSRFAGHASRLLREVKGDIRTAVVDRDVFGLKDARPAAEPDVIGTPIALNQAPPAKAFDFPRDDEKVDAFMDWLDGVMDAGFLETERIQVRGRGTPESAWANTYLRSAYQKGVAHAEYAASAAGITDSREEISMVFRAPKHANAAGLIFTRAYRELDGVSDAMDQQMSRALAEGLVLELTPEEIAANLNRVVDTIGINRAQLITQTESIRAFNEAALNRYEQMGVDNVTGIVEAQTAGDSRVCSDCKSIAGQRFPIREAHGKLPQHPRCRCTWVPATDTGKPATRTAADARAVDAYLANPRDPSALQSMLTSGISDEDVVELLNEHDPDLLGYDYWYRILRDPKVNYAGIETSPMGQDNEIWRNFRDTWIRNHSQAEYEAIKEIADGWAGSSRSGRTAAIWQEMAERTGNTNAPLPELLSKEIVSSDREAARKYIDAHISAMRHTFGDEITVFRGVQTSGRPGELGVIEELRERVFEGDESVQFTHRTIESWTLDPVVAANFAGRYEGVVFTRTITPEEAVWSSFFDDLIDFESEIIVASDTTTEYGAGDIILTPMATDADNIRLLRRALSNYVS